MPPFLLALLPYIPQIIDAGEKLYNAIVDHHDNKPDDNAHPSVKAAYDARTAKLDALHTALTTGVQVATAIAPTSDTVTEVAKVVTAADEVVVQATN